MGDSARDNTCSNGGSGASGGSAGSTANGGSSDSPGVGSGNTIQLPVSAPVNLCGNSVSVLGIGDTASDNTCSNGGSGGSATPPSHPTPPCGCHGTPPVTPPSTATTPPTTITTSPKPPVAPPHHVGASNGDGREAGSLAKTGSLAETGSGAGALVAPLGASMLGGSGLLVRKRMTSLHHLAGGRNR
ncbi:MAG TPA: chaplin [Actinospica sp.]|nr:chaplin [Actinospica sp.]